MRHDRSDAWAVPTARIRAWTPHVVVAIWLAFLGATIWWHATRSTQAPLWDPHSYVWKAKNFWDWVEQGQWYNPLELAPTVRPPGTILLSYPFGFSSSYAGFYFRSVFLPILCAALVPYLTLGLSRAFAWGWGTCLTVLLFTSLPMFYHFEWTAETAGTGGWGMVDSFLSGVTALSVAVLLRSLATASLARLAVGAALGAFTLFVKPAGGMVMILLAAMWFYLGGISWLRRREAASRRAFFWRYALPGALLLCAIFAASVLVCRSSAYLSGANFSYARKALAFERTLPAAPLRIVLASLYLSTGAFLPLWTAGIAFLALRGRRVETTSEDAVPSRHLLVCALGLLAAGACYWIVVQVLASQVRYFWPFLWMACVCLVPAAWEVWRFGGKMARNVFATLGILPAALLGLLLPLRRPPAAWQQVAGVHLDIGTSREAEDAAKALIPQLLETPGTKRIYSFASDLACGIFEHVIRHEALVRGTTQLLSIQHPYDWVKGFVIRTEEIAGADYLLFVPRRTTLASRSPGAEPHSTASFLEEDQAFESWVSTVGKEEGVVTEIDKPTLRVLRIVDRPAFEGALARFVASRRWRPEFQAENPRRWWTAAEVAALPDVARLKSVRFGKRYLVHAITLARVNEKLLVDLWWEPLRRDPRTRSRSWFFHLLGPDGRIMEDIQMPLRVSRSRDPERPIRFERALFVIDPGSPAVQVGVGLYSPESGGMLRADRGPRDFDGHRILMPVAAAVPGGEEVLQTSLGR